MSTKQQHPIELASHYLTDKPVTLTTNGGSVLQGTFLGFRQITSDDNPFSFELEASVSVTELGITIRVRISLIESIEAASE